MLAIIAPYSVVNSATAMAGPIDLGVGHVGQHLYQAHQGADHAHCRCHIAHGSEYLGAKVMSLVCKACLFLQQLFDYFRVIARRPTAEYHVA